MDDPGQIHNEYESLNKTSASEEVIIFYIIKFVIAVTYVSQLRISCLNFKPSKSEKRVSE